jgi:hypothetical protein
MASVQQTKVDELRREVMTMREALDEADSHVTAIGRRFGLNWHEVKYMQNAEAQVLVQKADEARDAWFEKSEELREAMWYLHHPNTPFVP